MLFRVYTLMGNIAIQGFLRSLRLLVPRPDRGNVEKKAGKVTYVQFYLSIRPIFKKTNPEPEIKPRIRIAGVPTEHLFSLDAWLNRKQICSVGTID